MRILSIGIIVVLCLTGCEASKQSRENSALSERYQQKMDKGETTPEQDKSFIRASTRAWYEMDAALRGRKKADATKAQAKALDNPINLDVK